MKRRLAKAVLMSLVFNGINVCNANTFEIKEGVGNEIIINTTSSNNIVDKSTSSDDNGISGDSGILKFEVSNL